MANVFETFNNSWRIPAGNYGTTKYETFDLIVYEKYDDGVKTITSFSMDNDDRLIKKTITSKMVRVVDTQEEVIPEPSKVVPDTMTQ